MNTALLSVIRLGVAGQEQIIEVPLHELDHVKGYGNLSLVWVPRSEQRGAF